MNKTLTIISLVGVVVALASFSAKVRSAELTPDLIAQAVVVPLVDIPHAERAVALAIRALGLDATCIANRALLPACQVSVAVVPDPVEANGTPVCGFMFPGDPIVFIVIGGGCARAVGDPKFMGTLVHEYTHILQAATGRYAGLPCEREYREIEAHAAGSAFTADSNDGRAVLIYLRQCAAKGAK